jgi:hypothetical protein
MYVLPELLNVKITTYLLSYSMVQDVFWKALSHSGCQTIPAFFMKPLGLVNITIAYNKAPVLSEARNDIVTIYDTDDRTIEYLLLSKNHCGIIMNHLAPKQKHISK